MRLLQFKKKSKNSFKLEVVESSFSKNKFV